MLIKQEVYDIVPKDVLKEVFESYRLDLVNGVHGMSHWARVAENGLSIVASNGGNEKVVICFALFHDAERENDHTDDGHGRRGANLLAKYRDRINISDEEFELCQTACRNHTDVIHTDNPTVSACFDADRLDLYRVGKCPDVAYLNNSLSKNNQMIAHAIERAAGDVMPLWAAAILDDLLHHESQEGSKL